MNELNKTLQRWLQRNIDFPLVLAMVTETPRWTVAFIAIHEPLWIGVPLGILLSFATSRAWRFYFETRSQMMLIFNAVSLAMAVFVITPVLFAMTQVPPHEVNIMQTLPVAMVWVWSAILALTTFVPLVQLAAAEAPHAFQPVPPAKTAKPKALASSASGIQDELPIVPAENASAGLQFDAYRNLQSKDEKVDAAHVLKMDFGLNNAEIANLFDCSESTVSRYLKTARNGTAHG